MERNKDIADAESFNNPQENQSNKGNTDYEPKMELSPYAAEILNALPLDGKKIGNMSLKKRLKFSDESYLEARDELDKVGLIVFGQGRGGSIGRARRDEGSNGLLAQREKLLNNLANPRQGTMDDKLQPASEKVNGTSLETEELSFDEEDTEEEDIDFGIQERQIFFGQSDLSVFELYGRHKDGDLILQPEFQRQFIWDFKKCSRLIESAILEVPLPTIYLAEEKGGLEAVIDGQQRLTAFFNYLDGAYPLTGINVIKELRGQHFADLDRSIQNLIKRCTIRTTTIKKESSESLRFEIFERLNTGAVSLNDQELRNCIFRGPYNRLLIELSQDHDFKYLIGITKLEKRMRDVELVLRFSAFYHKSYLHYTSPMKKFLDEDMSSYQYISDSDSADLKQAFKNSLHIIRSLFENHAFRRFYKGTPENPNGNWEPKTFSASLYDVLIYSFATKSKHMIFRHLDKIREAFLHLMTEDDDFIETIERGTSGKTMIVRRFDKWRLTLDSILVNDTIEPRCFSMQLKRELFQNDDTCSICKQTIQSIDDAAVDHIKQYWKGGRTIPENARLTHRFCNWARPRNE